MKVREMPNHRGARGGVKGVAQGRRRGASGQAQRPGWAVRSSPGRALDVPASFPVASQGAQASGRQRAWVAPEFMEKVPLILHPWPFLMGCGIVGGRGCRNRCSQRDLGGTESSRLACQGWQQKVALKKLPGVPKPVFSLINRNLQAVGTSLSLKKICPGFAA